MNGFCLYIVYSFRPGFLHSSGRRICPVYLVLYYGHPTRSTTQLYSDWPFRRHVSAISTGTQKVLFGQVLVWVFPMLKKTNILMANKLIDVKGTEQYMSGKLSSSVVREKVCRICWDRSSNVAMEQGKYHHAPDCRIINIWHIVKQILT